MRSLTRSTCLSLGLVLAAAAAQAAGAVSVTYVQQNKFADIGWSSRDVEDNLKELTRHFETLAARHLADGQKLNVEVLDVDLAGEMRWSRRAGQDLRVLRGRADWPRIKLRYTLEGAGQAQRSGEENVADMTYLQRIPGAYAGEPLHYEKRMLDQWFAAQFGAAAAK
jgi:hypothetical protein